MQEEIYTRRCHDMIFNETSESMALRILDPGDRVMENLWKALGSGR